MQTMYSVIWYQTFTPSRRRNIRKSPKKNPPGSIKHPVLQPYASTKYLLPFPLLYTFSLPSFPPAATLIFALWVPLTINVLKSPTGTSNGKSNAANICASKIYHPANVLTNPHAPLAFSNAIATPSSPSASLKYVADSKMTHRSNVKNTITKTTFVRMEQIR